MALAFAVVGPSSVFPGAGAANRRTQLVNVTGDGSSYAAGGFAVSASTVGFVVIDYIIPLGGGAPGSGGSGFAVSYDQANAKVKVWKGAGSAVLTEIANTDWTSSQVVTLLVVGA